MPTISVVIPTYHRYEALQDTVRDLLRQTVPPKEVVIVDTTTPADRDAPSWLRSSNGTTCIYISSPVEARVNVARNEGLRRVTGDYVLLLDDDMALPETCLEQFLEAHAAGADAVVGGLIENGDLLTTPHGSDRAFWNVIRHRHGPIRCHTIAVSSGFTTVRMDAIRAIGYLDEAFIYTYDDYDLGYRLWRAGFLTINDPRVSAVHRKNPQGGSRKEIVARVRAENSQIAKYYFIGKHFSHQAVRLEIAADILMALREWRRPLRVLTQLRLIALGWRRYQRYGYSASSATFTTSDEHDINGTNATVVRPINYEVKRCSA